MNIDYTAQHKTVGTVMTGIVILQILSEHEEEIHFNVFGPYEAPAAFHRVKSMESDWRPPYESLDIRVVTGKGKDFARDIAVFSNDDYWVTIGVRRDTVETWGGLNKNTIKTGIVISNIRSEHEDKFQINAFGPSEELYTCDKHGVIDGRWRFVMGIYTLDIELSSRNHQQEELYS